jgi:YD repeat-containing protein
MSVARTIFLVTLLHLPGAALLLALSAINARAQTSPTDGATPLGLAPGAPAGSYALSGFDNINPYNGGLNFRLPLKQIGGRGSAQYTMMVPIEQHWIVKDWALDTYPYHLLDPDPNWWEGIVPGYSPGVLEGRQEGDAYMPCNTPNTYGKWAYTLTRLTFTGADGTEYELRDQYFGGKPLENGCGSSNPWRGNVFVTADGSAATFVSDTAIYDNVLAGDGSINGLHIYPSGYLMLRDGSRYRIDGGRVTWLRDRNGNRVNFAYDSYHRVAQISDSINRVVTISYADMVSVMYDSISFKGFGGTSRTIRVWYDYLSNPNLLRAGYTPSQNPLFPELNGSGNFAAYASQIIKPWKIELPDGRIYRFYYNLYAELARVELPTGGAFEYDYTPGSGAVLGAYSTSRNAIYRRLVKRRVYQDGGTTPEGETVYTDSYDHPAYQTPPCGVYLHEQCRTFVQVDHFDRPSDQPGALLQGREKHYFYGDPRGSFFQQPLSYSQWTDGREYQTDAYNVSNGTPGSVLTSVSNTWRQRAPVSWWPWGNPTNPPLTQDSAPPNDPRMVEAVTTLTDTNQISKRTSLDPADPYGQTVGFDQFNNQTDVWEYDFGSGTVGALLRRSHTDYVTNTNYTGAVNAAHLRSLPTQTSIYDAGGTERARTTWEYDNYVTDTNHAALTDRPSISSLDSSFTTWYETRGNATATTKLLLAI